MKSIQPDFAQEAKAAKIVDLPIADFRSLVENGQLPKPREIGGFKLYDMAELKRVIRGDAIDGMGDVEW